MGKRGERQTRQKGGDPVGRGGSGQLPLSFNQRQDNQEKSYDSHKAMIFDVMGKARDGDKEAIVSGWDSQSSLRHIHCPRCGKIITHTP